MDSVFRYAPENIVVANTAYKPCNDSAPMAGITRKSSNSQISSVVDALHVAGVADCPSIADVANAKGGKSTESIAALASLVQTEMESGHKVNLGDLWATLQGEPFGYYDTISCGVLLGFVFSFYKNSKFTWTDSAQSPHVLAEATLSKLVSSVCKGKMTTDYLSAGSITWQNFSDYLGKILNLNAAQLAEQTTGYHNAREAITKSGAPFWALKYLPAETWTSKELQDVSYKVIDNIQAFITQDSDIEGAMSNVLQLLQGRGRVRVELGRAFADKSVISFAFRSFLFSVSPELKDVATRLAVTPEALSDKIHSVMQGAIYTWTEEQVAEKLLEVAEEYHYLEAIGKIQHTVHHSMEQAQKSLANLFRFLRVPMTAIAQLEKPWFPALECLFKVARGGAIHLSHEERKSDIEILAKYGAFAMDCLSDSKPVLAEILSFKNLDCSPEELAEVYAGLKDLTCDSSLNQFEKDLQNQINRISFARNRVILQETWRSMSGYASVKEWCTDFGVPIMWIIPKNYQKAFATLLDVQRNNHTLDVAVVSAINELHSMNASILTDAKLIEQSFLTMVGEEYRSIWEADRTTILAQAKIQFGNDMSMWSIADLCSLQLILKKARHERAKQEKLDGAKSCVRSMQGAVLRDRVLAFLEQHPEFCDDFSD